MDYSEEIKKDLEAHYKTVRITVTKNNNFYTISIIILKFNLLIIENVEYDDRLTIENNIQNYVKQIDRQIITSVFSQIR